MAEEYYDSRRITQDGDGWQGTRRWVVLNTNDPATAIADADIPLLNESWPETDYEWLRVRSREAYPEPKLKRHCIVVVTYTSRIRWGIGFYPQAEEGEYVRPTLSEVWTSRHRTRRALWDVDEDPIGPDGEGVDVGVLNPVLTISIRKAWNPNIVDYYQRYAYHTNSEEFKGAAAQLALCTDIRIDQEREGVCTLIFEIEFQVQRVVAPADPLHGLLYGWRAPWRFETWNLTGQLQPTGDIQFSQVYETADFNEIYGEH